MKRFPSSLLLSIFFVSFSAVEYEICMTRIFSLIFSYHFVFLSLSVAMCGLGIGGFLGTRSNFKEKNLLSISSLLAISFPLSVLVPLKFTFLLSHPILLSLFSIIPFILTGLFISLVFRFFSSFSGTIYFADLLGAALGSLFIVLILSLFSPINAVFFFSLLILSSNLLFFRKLHLIPFFFAVILCLFLNRGHSLLDIPYANIPDTRDTKEMVKLLANKESGARIENTYWNASFRTDVIYESISPNTRQIFIDGGTPTLMPRFNGADDSHAWLKKSLNYFPFLIAEEGDVLSIGPGGGLDVIFGVLAGFEMIEAVEVDSDILKILKDYEEFNGGILELAGVRYIVGEGRTYLKRRNKCYDLIYLALSQTATSSKMGLPLVESYLHTTDAYIDYLSHLKSKGLVAFICEPNFFLQRTIFNALLALKTMGTEIRNGHRHIVIISNPIRGTPYQHLLLLRKTAFNVEEVRSIWKLTEELGLIPRYFPYIYPKMAVEFSSLEEIEEAIDIIKLRKGIDVSPTIDEKPFFYDVSLKSSAFLYWICLFTLLSAILFSLFAKSRRSVGFIPYFSILGAGFMLIEVPLIQKFIFFLGYPITTFSVILFSLLLGCGLGGLIDQRTKKSAKVLPLSILGLCIVLLVLFLFLEDILLQLFFLNDSLKAIVSFCLLLPLGILLGMPFPSGMRRMGAVASQDIGLMWGVNGMMSVFGGCLSVIIAKHSGFKYSLLLALFLYMIIAIMSLKLFRK